MTNTLEGVETCETCETYRGCGTYIGVILEVVATKSNVRACGSDMRGGGDTGERDDGSDQQNRHNEEGGEGVKTDVALVGVLV